MLRIAEICRSIMGESPLQGLPCVILRLAGCGLRCRYCDTPYALVPHPDRTRELSVGETVEETLSHGPSLVLLTGGEPMEQGETPNLVERLLSRGATVVLETNGACDLASIPGSVIKVVDVKCPGSGESETFLVSNLSTLGPGDRLKFVMGDLEDYLWSVEFLRRHGLERGDGGAGGAKGPGVLFSPIYGSLEPGVLARWILEDGLEVQLNLQIHRYIGMP